jgi:hypothetical protein
MSEEKLYAVCIRETFAYRWGLGTGSDGLPIGVTKRQFVDTEIGRWLKEPDVLVEVGFKDFVEDMKSGFSDSKYARMLGWNYGKAAEMVESERRIFILISHLQYEARPYSYRSARDDDDYALQLVQDIYLIRGGRIILEEFDPEKHVKGYQPKFDN